MRPIPPLRMNSHAKRLTSIVRCWLPTCSTRPVFFTASANWRPSRIVTVSGVSRYRSEVRIEPEQIADGVGILLTFEPPHQNASAAHASQFLGLLEFRSHRFRHHISGFRIGLRIVVGRHRTAVDLIDNLMSINRRRVSQKVKPRAIANTQQARIANTFTVGCELLFIEWLLTCLLCISWDRLDEPHKQVRAKNRGGVS